jgi:hypothetical protein
MTRALPLPKISSVPLQQPADDFADTPAFCRGARRDAAVERTREADGDPRRRGSASLQCRPAAAVAKGRRIKSSFGLVGHPLEIRVSQSATALRCYRHLCHCITRK